MSVSSTTTTTATEPQPGEGQVLRVPPGMRWVQPRVVPAPPPLMPLALALGLGIAGDRVLNLALPGYAAPLSLVLCVALFSGWRQGIPTWLAQVGLFLAVLILGAGWHHLRWNGLATDDVARETAAGPRPAWLRGVPTSVPEYRPGLNPDDEGTTRLELDVVSRNHGRAWLPASGRLLILAGGNRTDIQMGHPVVVAGVLESMRGPRNPGEADLSARWQAQGIRQRLNADGPESLKPDPTGSIWPWTAFIGGIRTRCYERLIEGLRPDVAALAAALLLGRYDAVDSATFADFSRTGTTHLLAISGLHMQALATVLGVALTLLGVNRKPAALVVILATLAYTILVGPMPSVIRSAFMTILVALAVICDYPVRSSNVLAAAALLTLGFNPAFLFDAGCQLSFLAVGALFWAVPPVAAWLGLYSPSHPEPEPTTPKEWLDRLERQLASWPRKKLNQSRRWLMFMFLAAVVVWLITLPIIVWAFHLVPLAGSLLNVPLVALSLPTLISVVILLPAGWCADPFKHLARQVCEWMLSPQRDAVAWGANLPGAFLYAAGPSTWLVLLFYAALGATLSWAYLPGKGWKILAVTTLVGSVAGMVLTVALPAPPATLEAEVLAVDHGLAVLVRAPSGKTLLYDCGKMRDPHVGARVIAPALWARGVRSINTLVLSHADADHYGGLPDLLERFTIGEIRVPPGFERPTNPGLAELMTFCRSKGISVRELVEGQTIDLGINASCVALHPPPGYPAERPDNEHSLILNLTAGAHTLLLTGDLEGNGLARLLAKAPLPTEAILAPHHGSRAANPKALYRWASPKLILVSQRRPNLGAGDLPDWFSTDGRTTLTTWEQGAIQVQWTEHGLTAHGFLEPPR